MNSHLFLRNLKERRERVLVKLARMRAAKERKRLERGPIELEPKLIRSTGLSFAVRNDRTGEVVWRPLKSARDTFRRITILLRYGAA